jgi:hypothetical protein
MPGKVALILIFNHRYDKNIPVLEKLYSSRFSHIYHLVPFYDGDKHNVIPVYENSFYFQGYIAQGLERYYSDEFEHYIFAGDDLILNPAINEDNYRNFFSLPEQAGFIPEIFLLHDLTNNDTLRFEKFKPGPGAADKYHWWRIREAIDYSHPRNGAETGREIPAYEEADAILKKHGYAVQPLSYSDLRGGIFPLTLNSRQHRLHVAKYLYHYNPFKKKYRLSYPLVGSYSDLVIVPKESIRKFCHYCGVFAVNELFVEFAIPTALLLASERVVTEPQIGKRGEIYWTYSKEESENYEKQMQLYHYNLQELIANFPKDKLYIHPVKLSKWKTEVV